MIPMVQRPMQTGLYVRGVFTVARHLLLQTRLLAFVLGLCLLAGAAAAQTGGGNTAGGTSQSPKILLLLDLLEDQDVQSWVKQQRQQATEKQPEPDRPSPGITLVNRLGAIQSHVFDIVRAVPRLPGELSRAMDNFAERVPGYGPGWIVLLVTGFAALGAVAVWVFDRLSSSAWRSIEVDRPDDPTRRSRLIGQHLVLRVGKVVAFTLGSVVLFALLEWPALLEAAIVALLLELVVTWAAWNLLQVLFAPGREALRVVPVDDGQAEHMVRVTTVAIGWLAMGYVVIQLIRTLGIDFKVSQLFAYVLGLGLLAIGLRLRAGRGYALGFCTLWLLWALSAMKLFWLLAVVLALPLAVRYARLSVEALFRPGMPVAAIADAHVGDAVAVEQPASVWATVVERAVRAALIFGAIVVLAWGWNLSLTGLADNKDLLSRLARSGISVLTIYLLGDLAWQLIRTLIDAKLSSMPDIGESGQAETVRAAKLRTLLPIVRNGAMVFLLTLTVFMGLSAVGIEIGPLIASAGIVGVAIGFGAQTLVKDIISGMFYLFDDAF
ncbi:MAG: hypothetical protein V2I51_13720, partial [Anderseniella sp.]|nr:hypothetical protein [Anderseniella sp.]